VLCCYLTERRCTAINRPLCTITQAPITTITTTTTLMRFNATLSYMASNTNTIIIIIIIIIINNNMLIIFNFMIMTRPYLIKLRPIDRLIRIHIQPHSRDQAPRRRPVPGGRYIALAAHMRLGNAQQQVEPHKKNPPTIALVAEQHHHQRREGRFECARQGGDPLASPGHFEENLHPALPRHLRHHDAVVVAEVAKRPQ
jgi:hypothetical protein